MIQLFFKEILIFSYLNPGNQKLESAHLETTLYNSKNKPSYYCVQAGRSEA